MDKTFEGFAKHVHTVSCRTTCKKDIAENIQQHWTQTGHNAYSSTDQLRETTKDVQSVSLFPLYFFKSLSRFVVIDQNDKYIVIKTY